jgi:hypothetical protein
VTPTRHMQRPWPGGWRSTSHRIAHSAGRRLSRQRHSSWSRQWSDTTGTSRTPGARAWSPQQGTMSCGSPPFERALMRTDHCQGIGGAGSGPSKGILVQCKPIVENAMFTCGQWDVYGSVSLLATGASELDGVGRLPFRWRHGHQHRLRGNMGLHDGFCPRYRAGITTAVEIVGFNQIRLV